LRFKTLATEKFRSENYRPLGFGEGAGFGGLLPLFPPDGLPVVLGAFGGFDVPFAII
jgi:hypothetical protein